jgi:ribosomal protein L16/L10AE
MGKGKGQLERWTIRVRCGLIFLEFKGVHFFHINNIRNRFQKRVNIEIVMTTRKKV